MMIAISSTCSASSGARPSGWRSPTGLRSVCRRAWSSQVNSGAKTRSSALAQLVGAAAIAAACTVPLLLPASAELDAVRFLLAAFISVVAYAVVRSSPGDDSSRLRALAYASVVLCIALTVATAKNTLSGH